MLSTIRAVQLQEPSSSLFFALVPTVALFPLTTSSFSKPAVIQQGLSYVIHRFLETAERDQFAHRLIHGNKRSIPTAYFWSQKHHQTSSKDPNTFKH